MGMTRQDRVGIHKKQERLLVSSKPLNKADLKEGVPVLHLISGALVEYIKYNNIIYNRRYEVVSPNAVYSEPVEDSIANNSLSSEPDYDSGWVAATNDGNYDFTHNLGTQMLFLQIYIKDASNRIFKAQSYQDYGGNYEGGISVYFESNDKINIGTANDAILTYDNTSIGSSVTKVTNGSIRVLAWKIQGL